MPVAFPHQVLPVSQEHPARRGWPDVVAYDGEWQHHYPDMLGTLACERDWYPLFPSPVVAESLLDRLINTSYQAIMNGPGYRPNKRPRNSADKTKFGPFGPVPTALSAGQVARAAELLGQIDFPALLAALLTDEAESASLIGNGADKIVGGPKKCVRGGRKRAVDLEPWPSAAVSWSVPTLTQPVSAREDP
ncbi:hypothetical protein ACFC09_44710 [Streptomyces sp. NPDC056161]|uniref:hypothetical protein n=1 Tax=Streptomyces sp. NPDC056161 TaxID=3345732 RepID=UPI0035E1E992